MHCYLYHRLYGSFFNPLHPTKEGHETILLHKYPTESRYRRQEDQRLKTDDTASRRGRLDISIWDPTYIREREHRLAAQV